MDSIKKNTIYFIGRPETFSAGRLGKKSTTYTTAIVNEKGEVVYGQQTFMTLGTFKIPKGVIKVTKSEFEKMLKTMK